MSIYTGTADFGNLNASLHQASTAQNPLPSLFINCLTTTWKRFRILGELFIQMDNNVVCKLIADSECGGLFFTEEQYNEIKQPSTQIQPVQNAPTIPVYQNTEQNITNGWAYLASKSVNSAELTKGRTMMFETFQNSMESLHIEFKNKETKTFKLYCDSLAPFGIQTSLNDILAKMPAFAQVFLFFVKIDGKGDPSMGENCEFNLCNLTLDELSRSVDQAVKSTKIEVLLGTDLNSHFEQVLGHLNDSNVEHTKKFWEVFINNGVDRKVINDHGNRGISSFMKRLFAEGVNDTLQSSLLRFMNDSCKAYQGTVNLKWKGFPWASSEEFMAAYRATLLNTNYPTPNVHGVRNAEWEQEAAKELENWLTDIFKDLTKKPDVSKYANIIRELGAETKQELNDLGCEISDLQFGGIPQLHAKKIMTALTC